MCSGTQGISPSVWHCLWIASAGQSVRQSAVARPMVSRSMRRPADQLPAGARRKKGEKANKKQMAAVGCVYTVDRKVRIAEEVVAALRTTHINGQWKEFQKYHIKQERQRLYPQHKWLKQATWPMAA
jgi:hypothetical protein